MATKIRRSLLFLLSALGAACGGDPGMMSAPDGASSVLDEATRENGRHAEACRDAGSMSAMLNDVSRHEVAMNGLMARMAEASDQMRTEMMETHACSEQDPAHMSQDLSETNAELATHFKQMRAADTLGAGHFECSVHARELRNRLESMRNDWGSMSCTPK